ncbi:uncharacterized protein LOC112468163 [Temnothorax curvispinosus]|uniref:Uncharacterized protein LOC112468163 n=1 Tax=Temnothorax curvispinosus TaxID=300111 RepID=A0A6J1RJN1_9HYME|nr:uncharacterized protein LOC112468163 [Temnothorax curvispinosus]
MRCFRCDRYFAPSTCDACLRTYWLEVARAPRASGAPARELESPDSPPPPYEDAIQQDMRVAQASRALPPPSYIEAIREEVPPLRVFVNVNTGAREVTRGFRRILTTRREMAMWAGPSSQDG